MPISYSWKINSLAVHPAPIDGAEGVIVNISASRVATDGTNTVQDARVVRWRPDELSGPFKPKGEVTEADVIGWVEAHEATNGVIDGETSLDRADADLASQLVNYIPAPEMEPLPWADA